MSDDETRDLIEASSLGTPEARALRAEADDATVARILSMAADVDRLTELTLAGQLDSAEAEVLILRMPDSHLAAALDAARTRAGDVYCGCCGAGPLADGGDWCEHCYPHVLPAQLGGLYLHLWERTYLAQHERDCPRQVPS